MRYFGSVSQLSVVLGCLLSASACGPEEKEDDPEIAIAGVGADAGIAAEVIDCTPKECEELGFMACGSHDDGCGGSVYCGECNTCARMNCDDLGASCGAQDDGCGGTVQCGDCGEGATCEDGTCACAPDGAESNDTPEAARALGTLDDGEETPIAIHEALGAVNIHTVDDEDWYSFEVVDSCCDGNPSIEVKYPIGFEVGAWLACPDGAESYATCDGPGVMADTSHGVGCVGAGPGVLYIYSECDGLDDSGSLLVRVKARRDEKICQDYEVTVTAS